MKVNKKSITSKYQNIPRTRKCLDGSTYIIGRETALDERRNAYLTGIEEKKTNPLVVAKYEAELRHLQNRQYIQQLEKQNAELEKWLPVVVEEIDRQYVETYENATGMDELDMNEEKTPLIKSVFKMKHMIVALTLLVVVYAGYTHFVTASEPTDDTTAVEQTVELNENDPKAQE